MPTKKFKLLVPILVLSGFFVFLGESLAPPRGYRMKKPPELEAKLELFKKEYLVREPIWVKVQVTNVGEEEGDFYFMTSDRLTIKDSKGKVYPCNIFVEYMGPVTIKPHETLENGFEVTGSYGLPEHRFAKRFPNRWWWYLPPNKYTVYYELSYLLKKSVKSPVDSFEVLEPKGGKIKAMNLLVDSYDLLTERKVEGALGRLDELIRQYPKSVYLPFAWSSKINIYRIYLEDWARSLSTCIELIERYPHSQEAIAAVKIMTAIYQTQKDKNGFLKAMNDLIKKYPNSDISKEAEKQLKQVKDKDFK